MARHPAYDRGPGDPDRPRGGGIPDGLLIGLLALLVAATLITWTATGLAGLLTHGAWPDGVTFTRSPIALRDLLTAPQDLPAAWPATPAAQLSGFGLFWGLFIGELMVLAVLAVFALGVVARGRAVRQRRREERSHGARPERHPAPRPDTGPGPRPPVEQAVPDHRPPAEQPRPPAPAGPPVATGAAPGAGAPAAASGSVFPAPRAPFLGFAPAPDRRPTAVRAIREAAGPVLVVTSDPTVWADTKDARAKLGPVLVHDPGHLCDTPSRLHWSPTEGCEAPEVAAARAAALLAPVRPQARLDTAVADTAQTLLQCRLHAAAVDGRPFRQVLRWSAGAGTHEAVRLLRTHPKAASGLAGLLESALTAYPERRELAEELTVRAFAALSTVHIREACTPNRADSLALASFAAEGGTLYLVGESIEDPRSRPGAMPLLTALAADVVEHGRRMAARSSDGRLDPPMTLVLDDVAAVAPFPRLPQVLATGQDLGMPALVLLRSREQARSRWREDLRTPVPGSG